MAVGKIMKVGVEFSLEDPQGGIHFVVPEGEVGTGSLIARHYQQIGMNASAFPFSTRNRVHHCSDSFPSSC